MELRPLAYYRRNSEEYQRERNSRGQHNSAFSHFSHRDQIVNSSVTPIHENNIQTVFTRGTQWLKITEKVSFNIASEASYVYILNGQKLIKNAKNCPFWRVFENLQLAVKQRYQTDHFY